MRCDLLTVVCLVSIDYYLLSGYIFFVTYILAKMEINAALFGYRIIEPSTNYELDVNKSFKLLT